MKKFLLKTFLLAVFMLLIYTVIFVITPAKSFSADYIRVSSPKYPSLIIGTSMSARGLSPAIVQQQLNNCYQFPMMNFSFNIGIPYGEVYFNRIKEKVKLNFDGNSLFIVSVDPYSLGDFDPMELNTNRKREELSILAELKSVINQPNWEYFFKYIFFTKGFVSLKFNSHDGGCDQYGFDASNLDMLTDPEWKKRERIETHILPYYEKDVIPTYRFSEERTHSLAQIISFLKKNGDVFLVRMPFEDELFECTNKVFPHFDKFMQDFANENSVHYISFWRKHSSYKTTDGVHLYKIEAERITKDICDSIRVLKARPHDIDSLKLLH